MQKSPWWFATSRNGSARTCRHAFALAFTLVGASVLVSACGGDSSDGSTSNGGDGGSGSSAPSASACTEIAAPAMGYVDATITQGSYGAVLTPSIGGEQDDVLSLIVKSEDKAANFDLGGASSTSCTHCLWVHEDVDDTGVPQRWYYQKSGTLVIDDGSQPLDGLLDGKLVDVTLVEVTLDENGGAVPVSGGACLHLATAEIHSTPPDSPFPSKVPSSWTCDASAYGDGTCTCGCGTYDVDCETTDAIECIDCLATGSCSTSCDDIVRDDNAKCR